MSSRRALAARRSGPPKNVASGSSPAYQPADCGTTVVQALGRDRHERRAARRHQPLVRMRGDHVEAAARRAAASRLPASRRRPSSRRARGRGCDGVEIGDLARRHLHGAERDHVHVRPDLARQLGGGTSRVVTPRCSCTRNGKSSDVNSTSGASTREPSGIEAATSPTSVDTFGPMATLSTGTPTSRAKDARASSPGIPQCSQLVRPPCQSSSALWSASHAGRGGRPYDAVLRYVAAGLHSSCASATLHPRQSDAPELDSLSWRRRPRRRLSGAQRRRRR